MQPVHVINIDIQDNHEEATIGAFVICELAKLVRSEFRGKTKCSYSHLLSDPLSTDENTYRISVPCRKSGYRRRIGLSHNSGSHVAVKVIRQMGR